MNFTTPQKEKGDHRSGRLNDSMCGEESGAVSGETPL